MAARRQEHPDPRRPGAGARIGSWIRRGVRAWRVFEPDERVAAAAALGLFVTMLLPWYTKTNTLVVRNVPRSTQTTFSAFGAFSFVEAAVLLVSASVLVILFARAERRAFHLPGGDGTIIMLAGGWAAALIFYRMLDKPSLHGNEIVSATEGITWGIFVALLVALGLAYAGARVRAAARPEPPLMTDDPDHDRHQAPDLDEDDPLAPTADPVGAANRGGHVSSRPVAPTEGERAGPRRPRYPPSPAEPGAGRRSRMVTRDDAAQLSFEDPPAEEPFDGEPPPPRRRRRR